MNALFNRFVITGSCQSGAAISLISTPGRPGCNGELSLTDKCWMWKTGRSLSRQAAINRPTFCSAFGLFLVPQIGESNPT